MSSKIDPLPDKEELTVQQPSPVKQGQTGQYIGPAWYRWLYNVRNVIVNSTQQIGSTLNLTAQNASIPTTGIPLPALANGPYRVVSYLRVTQPDAVNSSIQITIGWTDSGATLTSSGAPLTGNTTSTVQGLSFPVLIDQGSALTYSTTYSSNTPGQMQYKLTLVTESI